MEVTHEKSKLTKWGNGQGIRLSKQVMQQLDFHIGTDLLLDMRETPSGKKQLIITEADDRPELSIEEKLAMLDSLHGILEDTAIPKDIDIKQDRRARRIKRIQERNDNAKL